MTPPDVAPSTSKTLESAELVALNAKVAAVFRSLAIDKRRLPASQLSQRGIPAYVAEWVLESVVPGQGELNTEETAKVLEWATRVIPGPSEQNIIKHKLAQGANRQGTDPASG